MSNIYPKDLLLEKLKAMLAWKKSKAFYAEQLGITEEEIDELKRELKESEEKATLLEKWIEPVEGYHKLVEEKQTEDGQKMEIKALWSAKPASPSEIEEHHNIDRKLWKLSSYWSKLHGDKWSVSAYFKRIDIETDLTTQKELLLQELKCEGKEVKVVDYTEYIEKRSLEELFDCELSQYFEDDIEKEGFFTGKKSLPPRKTNLLEISIFDPHFGKLAWAAETGEDYDIDIAEKRYIAAIDSLLSRVNLNGIAKIHLPVGNDLFHIDSGENTTTAGTPQDCDSRFGKMVQRVKRLMIATIEKLAKHAKVDVTIISGNHDNQSTFMLGEILDAYFHRDDRVNINNSPKQRKFYRYGVNGFMYTHGNEEKQTELPLIFATEEPELWAATKYRFAKIGHFHHNKKMEYVSIEDKKGCQIQILPSLSGTDEWHYKKGYFSNKQAKAFLYHLEEGEIATYTYNV